MKLRLALSQEPAPPHLVTGGGELSGRVARAGRGSARLSGRMEETNELARRLGPSSDLRRGQPAVWSRYRLANSN